MKGNDSNINWDIIEKSGSIILCMDRQGKVTYCNEYGLSFFGYSYDELIGRHVLETIVPLKESSGRILTNLIDKICRRPNDFSINENENRKKDGSLVWVLWSNKPIKNDKGEVIGILCIGNDMTKHRNIEEAIQRGYNSLVEKITEQSRELRERKEDILFEKIDKNLTLIELKESEEKYRNIVECAVEGIFQVTENGRFIMANKSLSKILGYESPDELINNVKDYGREMFVDKDERENFESMLKSSGYVENYETRFFRRDGSKIWVNMNVRAVYDFMGKVMCFEGTIEDTTEKKNKEKMLQESLERLQKVMDDIINALSTTLELKDPYTSGHQKRVTELALAIAKEMNYPDQNMKLLRIASMLHDIGKISMPAEILSKPGRLNKKEFDLLKDHPERGYEILKGIDFNYPVAEIIKQHHERMDGSGYPSGLKGDDILMDARIIGVADVVESMASHRPYRPSLGMDIALEEIEKNKGILYDSDVVEACVKVIREKGFKFDQ
ncbi:MAG: PAS domain S-box protein [Syntrophorhabdaceae bacterium]|nr:PAS domain S-box protein [Syntrophorhabdaceae bacterium]